MDQDWEDYRRDELIDQKLQGEQHDNGSEPEYLGSEQAPRPPSRSFRAVSSARSWKLHMPLVFLASHSPTLQRLRLLLLRG